MSDKFDSISEEVQKLASNKSLDSILKDANQMLSYLKSLEESIKNDESHNLKLVSTKVRKLNDNILKHEKSINKSIKNYSAKVDKIFTFNLIDVYHYKTIDVKSNKRTQKLMDRAVLMNLLRNGHFDVASSLEKERRIAIPFELINKFKKLNDMLERLKDHDDLKPAVEWAYKHSDRLKEIGSDLEFNLHKLQFIMLYNTHKGEPYEAYEYAKNNFPNFGITHLDVISKLFFSMMYSTATTEGSSSSVKDYLNDINLSSEYIYNQLCQDYCSLLGLSSNSPIYNTLMTSYVALPSFIKYNKIFKNSSNLNWTTTDELPFEINLPPFLQFHSIFICPVSKEETTPTNPPMVLPCRHILSKESLNKLSKNNMASFKCPYCPTTCTGHQGKQARFINI